MYLGPLGQMAVEAISGHDLRTGEPIERPWLAWPGEDSRLERAVWGLVERPTKAATDLVKLYTGRPEQMDIAFRMSTGRSWVGLDAVGSKIFGYEPRSIGGMFDWDGGGFPGFSVYPANPYIEGSRVKRKAIEGLKGRERGLERALPGGR